MNCRQNWSNDCENALNEQIEREYSASLSYRFGAYFDRDDVGLKKLVDYFNKSSLEERDHANELMHTEQTRWNS